MTVVADDDTILATGVGDGRSHEAIVFIHALLQGIGQERTFSDLLRDLGRAFAAASIGLAVSCSESPIVQHHVNLGDSLPRDTRWPWEEQPKVLAEVGAAAGAIAVTGGGATWLLAPVREAQPAGWIIWLEGAHERSWTKAEGAALCLAGQALARVKTLDHSDRWKRSLEQAQFQDRLDHAAAITRRLAHDFGNILTGILGFAELSLTQLPADSLPWQYVKEAWQSARRGADWVHTLQVFSRRSRRSKGTCRLAPVLAADEDRLRTTWGDAITFLVACPNDLPPIAIDLDPLRQVLAQLLTNAREAIAERGAVTLSARNVTLTGDDCLNLIGNAGAGPHIEITIADTGCGIDMETRRRLLTELFFSSKHRHRGMGLPSVFGHLFTYHGGMRFESDAGPGTTIRVFLPTVTAPVSPHHGAPILVVETDPVMLELVSQALAGAGYRVQGTADPDKAIDIYANAAAPFRLVVADVLMPLLGGFDMARKLRALDPNLNCLFITGHVFTGPPDDMLKDFLVLKKPFVPSVLQQAVAAALGRPCPC